MLRTSQTSPARANRRGWRRVLVSLIGGTILTASTVGAAGSVGAQEGKDGRGSESEYVEPTLRDSSATDTEYVEPTYRDSSATDAEYVEPIPAPRAEKEPPGPEPTPVSEKGEEVPDSGVDSRIVGGAPASVGEYPYIVSLQRASDGFHRCGGTLVSTTRVITAAHCVEGAAAVPSFHRVRVGGTVLSGTDTGVIHNVSAITVHPSYDSNFGPNDVPNFDVAVLTLSTPVTRTEASGSGTRPRWIRPAIGNENSLVDPGDTSTVIGHGATCSGCSGSNALLEVNVPIQSDATMENPSLVNPSIPPNFDPPTMLGAGPLAGGQDSCQGDSGGPLIITTVSPDILIGDVSWGFGCAAANNPGIYGELYQGSLRTFVNGQTPRPGNDNFPGFGIGGNAGSIGGNNTDSTEQPNEANGVGTADSTVWYSWTPSVSGPAQIAVNQTVMDSTLNVYTGNSVSGLSFVTGNDDANGSLQSQVNFNAVAGTTYRIQVDGFGYDFAPFRLSYGVNPPANDNFPGTTISGVIGQTSGATTTATGQAGEPALNLGAADASVWFSWTAPETGNARFTTNQSGYDTTLAAFTGSGVGSLTTVANNDDFNGTFQSLMTFNVVAGTTYRIQVGGFAGSRGSFQLQWANNPPANDQFAAPQVLGGTEGTIFGSNARSTGEPGEPNLGSVPDASVWYSWTAPSSGPARFTTNQSNFDTVLTVVTGTTIGGLTTVASNDQFNGTDQSLVNFNAVAGTTYRIWVDGFGNTRGNITLQFALNPPANDLFASPQSLGSASQGRVTGSNVGSTGEPGEPHLGSVPDASVWYSWTAPASGTARFSTGGSSFDTVLAVVTGSSITGLTLVTSNDQFNGTNQSLVTFAAVSGTTYRIQVDGFSNTRGSIVLNWGLNPPANDLFANAQAIAGTSGQVAGTTANAVGEPGEPTHHGSTASNASVWYAWTAPQNGTITFQAAGGTDTLMAAYTGATITTLTKLTSDDDSGPGLEPLISFPATSGTVYRIAVDPFGDSSSGGAFELRWNFLTCGSQPVTIQGSGTINGTAGNDTIRGSSAADSIDSGAGNDVICSFGGSDTINGGPDNDTIFGGGSADDIDAGTGDDFVDGGPGGDAINGGAGNDTIAGGEGHDSLDGGAGNDTITGGGNNDTIRDGFGADTVFGGPGNEVLIQGTVADPGDVFSGGSGIDRVVYADRTGDVTVTLNDTAANDGEAGEADQVLQTEYVTGGAGNDTIVGNNQANLFIGGDGNDNIDGGPGDDQLRGGNGNDTLVGGTGADLVQGQGHNDALNVQDGVNANDTADGGPGTDTALADPGDTVLNVP